MDDIGKYMAEQNVRNNTVVLYNILYGFMKIRKQSVDTAYRGLKAKPKE